MIKNFFRVAYRNIVRSKGFSFINISGLAIGMASAMLILLWVQNEMSYDNFYPKKDRLYQAWNKDRGNEGIHAWSITPKILGPVLKQEIPEIEQTTRVNWDATILFTAGEKKLNVNGTMVDPDFLTMFDFRLLKGDAKTALSDPSNIILTEKLSGELFGKEDAIGKTVLLDNKYNFKVSAVMQDLPNNTNFNFRYLLPWSFMRTRNEDDSSWGQNSTHNYVLLTPHADLAAVNAKILRFIPKHGGDEMTTSTFLYPVSKLRLYSSFENGLPAGGKIKTVRVFILIAIFILLIACINFMNMSTARSEKRGKEVGIRKVVGARRGSLIAQFLGESILIASIGGTLALLIVELCMPAFNTLTIKHLAIDYGSVHFWLLFIGFILFTGITAGSYPAFFLSSFQPVSVLKGVFKKAHALITPRKVLVVLQFTFAIVLIVCTLIIEKQLKYARERTTGYNKNNLTYTFISGDMEKNYSLIKNDLLDKGVALSVSKTSAPLTEGWSSGGADWTGKDPNDRTEFNFFYSDDHIVRTSGMELINGRDLDLANYPTDSTAAIVNEATVKTMGFKNPIGQTIGHNGQDWHVIGVIKDFILQSPYDPIRPMLICGARAGWFNLIHVKFNDANTTAGNLAAMEKIFKQYNPKYPFEYHFIDEQYALKFNDEKTTGILTAFFAGLTIFISCLGLFGLATYMAENRIKEIGVRKVLGASVTGLTAMLSKDFIKLVIIAILLATPIALWSMNKWLAGYKYHINISWLIFLEAGLMAITIALLTVSFQAIRAAIANPIKSLRSE